MAKEQKRLKNGDCPACGRKMIPTITGGLGCPTLGKAECVRNTKPDVGIPTDYADLTDVAAGVVAGAYKVAGVGRTTVLAWMEKLAVCAEDTATEQSLALAKSLRKKMQSL